MRSQRKNLPSVDEGVDEEGLVEEEEREGRLVPRAIIHARERPKRRQHVRRDERDRLVQLRRE